MGDDECGVQLINGHGVQVKAHADSRSMWLSVYGKTNASIGKKEAIYEGRLREKRRSGKGGKFGEAGAFLKDLWTGIFLRLIRKR